MLPFLSQRYAVRAAEIVANTPSENVRAYDEQVRQVIGSLTGGFSAGTVNLVMSHITCVGGTFGGGERSAQSIFEYSVPASIFPISAHYVALGHLHRRQALPAPAPVHYSGAPLAVDFGEQDNTSVVCLVEAAPGIPARITDVPVTSGRRQLGRPAPGPRVQGVPGQHRQLDVLPGRAGPEPDQPALARRARPADQGDARDAHQRPVGVEGRRVVVVARDRDDLGPGPPQRQQRPDHELLGRGRGRHRVVQVAGDQDRVDLLFFRDPDDLAEDGALLLDPVAALEGLADVPVGGVQELHGLPLRNHGP